MNKKGTSPFVEYVCFRCFRHKKKVVSPKNKYLKNNNILKSLNYSTISYSSEADVNWLSAAYMGAGSVFHVCASTDNISTDARLATVDNGKMGVAKTAVHEHATCILKQNRLDNYTFVHSHSMPVSYSSALSSSTHPLFRRTNSTARVP
jgi:hypothetical protein